MIQSQISCGADTQDVQDHHLVADLWTAVFSQDEEEYILFSWSEFMFDTFTRCRIMHG